jgi:hypothetical protein
MKQLKCILVTLIAVYATPCYGTLTAGFVTQETITGNMTNRAQLFFASDGQNYTSGVGGITFSYPTNWFTVPPIVQVSVLQNAAHPTNITYVANITASSATTTTVMVYEISFGAVTEAPTNSVTVCLLAIEDPT